MKKTMLLLVILIGLISCRSKREDCIQDLVDNKGYSYDDACDVCDEEAIDTTRE